MALAFAQNLGNLSTSSATSLAGTFGSSTVSGNAIGVITRVGAQGRTVTGSDNKSNTYAQAKNQTFNTGNELFGHYALNITGGASHQVTISISGAAASIRLTLHEESGVATSSALDQTNGNFGNSTALDSGNVTTAQADEWIFGGGGLDGDQTFTAGTNFGHLAASPSGGGVQRQASEDRIVAATGTYSASFSIAGALDWGCIVLTFKAATGGSNKAVTPAAVNATSTVTASLQKLAAVTPAAVTSSSPVTASLAALKQFHAAVAATSTVTATATRIASLHAAAVNATSSVGAAISGIAQNVVDNFRMKKRRRF